MSRINLVLLAALSMLLVGCQNFFDSSRNNYPPYDGADVPFEEEYTGPRPTSIPISSSAKKKWKNVESETNSLIQDALIQRGTKIKAERQEVPIEAKEAVIEKANELPSAKQKESNRGRSLFNPL